MKRGPKQVIVQVVSSWAEEHPWGHGLPRVRGFELPRFVERLQDCAELWRHVDAPDLVRFRRGFLPAYNGSADLQKLTVEIHITPLQTDQFTLAKSRAHGTEEEGVETGTARLYGLEEALDFLRREWVDMRVGGFPCGEEAPEVGHGIAGH
jgi:hypothetical protein